MDELSEEELLRVEIEESMCDENSKEDIIGSENGKTWATLHVAEVTRTHRRKIYVKEEERALIK